MLNDVQKRAAAVTRGWLDGKVGVPGAPVLDERVEGELVPDLSALAPEDWVPALRPLGRKARFAAVCTLDGDGRSLTMRYVRELPRHRPGAAGAQTAIDQPAYRPVPTSSGARRAHRQVNFRLTDAEYGRLSDAAETLGMTAPALAKAFCLSGTNRALQGDR